MKTIFLSTKGSHQDLLNYGSDLVEEVKALSEIKMYEEFLPDFSNVPELYDDSEKLVIFNHFAVPEGFFAFSKFLPTFKNVKFVLSPYSRYEGLDLELVKKMGIKYRNNAGANARSVAQYAVTSMLMLLSKFPVFGNEEHIPDGSILGEEFHHKSVGIIGMGNVGKELCRTLKSLGMNVSYYNRTSVRVDARQVSFEEIFQQDIIFITIATNTDTRQLLEKLPDLLNPKNYLIDISNSDDFYDKKKVIDLLRQDKLRGFANEAEEVSQFRDSSKLNLIITPHIAWCTIDAEKRTVENVLHYAIHILKGEPEQVDFIV